MLDQQLPLPSAWCLLGFGSDLVMASDVKDEMRAAASDLVSFNLAKADALIAAITGAQHEAFAALNEELQGRYLWALNDLIQDAHRAREIEVTCDARDAMHQPPHGHADASGSAATPQS